MIRSAVYVVWNRDALGATLLLCKATRTIGIGNLVYASGTSGAWQRVPSN